MNLRVDVDRVPSAFLLRAAIETVLRGGAWPAGPEADVAAAVAKAVRATRAESGPASESGTGVAR